MTGDEFHLTRRRWHIRQEEIARRAGITQSWVSAVEREATGIRPETRQHVIDTLLEIAAEREAATPKSA